MRLPARLLAWTIPCLLLLSEFHAVAGDPLKLIPDEAAIIIVCPSLRGLEQDIRGLGKALEIDDLIDWQSAKFFDELDLMDSTDGLDRDGALIIAVSNDFQPLVICGLKDADAWRTAVKARGGPDVLELQASGGDHYACIRDGFVAVAGDEALIESVIASKGRIAARVRERADKLDPRRSLYVYVELPPLRGAISRGLELLLGFMEAGMQMSGAAGDVESGIQFWRFTFELIRGVIEESEFYVAAVRVGEEGIRYEERVAFSGDGKFAAYLRRARPAEAPLLRGLSDHAPMAIIGAEWIGDGKGDSAFAGFVLQMLSSDSIRKCVGERYDDAVRLLRELYNQISGYCSTFELTDEFRLCVQGYYYSGNPAATYALVKRAFETSPELMAAQSAAVSCKVQTGSETIAGHECLTYDVEFLTDDQAVRQVLETFYGAKMRIYVCQTDFGVFEAMGDPTAGRAAIAAVLARDAKPLSSNPRVNDALARHSPRPQLVFMVDAARVVDFGMRVAAKMGLPVPRLKWPEAAQPLVSYAGYLEPTAYRGELIVPIQPMQAIRKALRQVEKPGVEKY